MILTISRAKDDNDDGEKEKLLLERVSAHSRDLLSVGEIFGLHKSTLRPDLEIFGLQTFGNFWAPQYLEIFGLHKSTLQKHFKIHVVLPKR